MALLAGYNICLILINRQSAMEMAGKQAELEEEKAKLEELKKEIAAELAEYYPGYRAIKEEFIEEAAGFSEELKNDIINMAKLNEITSARLDLALDYRDKFVALDTPAPLKTFSSYELEYIESDIQTIREALLYYGSGSYSTYDDSNLNELYIKTDLLYRKAQEELHSVYIQYGLEFLFE